MAHVLPYSGKLSQIKRVRLVFLLSRLINLQKGVARTMRRMAACGRESGNFRDPFAVAVKKNSDIVGHVPRRISSVCSMLLRRGRSIHCRVTVCRRYSADLTLRGLRFPAC